MAIYIQPTDPPTTTQSPTTPTTLATSTGSLTTTTIEEKTTEIGIVPSQSLRGTAFTEDTNNSTSGTVTLVNLKYLLIKLNFVACFIIIAFVCL